MSSIALNGKRTHLMYGNEARGQGLYSEPLVERTVIGASSVPGETRWARQANSGSALEDAVASLELEPETSTVNVLLKVYDNGLADELRPAELVDVIGTLDTFVPSSMWLDETGVGAVPVPCIHVFALRRTNLGSIAGPVAARMAPCTDKKARYDALVYFVAGALAGDLLAAEYVVLSLLARIHWRAPGAAVGALSVNISRAEKLAPALASALNQICPAVKVQSLALSTLNDASTPLFPQETDSGLRPGRLQLVDGTVLLVDEAAMDEGQLGDTGVRNVRALAQLLSRHTLPYLFPFSEFEINTDINVLVLSSGRSFLPVDAHVPWRPGTGEGPRDTTQPTLDALRAAILEARTAALTVPDAVSEIIQTFFVERRKTDPKYTQEDLQRHIGIARLLALGAGASTLSEREWSRAVEL